MKIVESFVVACSMYSKIPMPQIEWNKENMKYAMCFFPFVGIVIGVCQYIVGRLLFLWGIGDLFRAAVLTLIPVFISGGIHLDGFMDTMDALASCCDRERKLEILKDSTSGAFAILGMVCYFVWNVAVWTEVRPEMLGNIAGIYALSRTMSSWSVMTFRSARENGLAKTFQKGAEQKKVAVVMVICFVLCAAYQMLCNWMLGLGTLAAAVGSFLYYRYISYKQFGGVTGDLAGFFLQINELAMLTLIVIVGVVI